jgi:hypothetical protein
MAQAQLWISIASILAVFKIVPGRDEDGRPFDTEAAFDYGMLRQVSCCLGTLGRAHSLHSTPKPFKCRIEPRDSAAVSSIRSARAWPLSKGMA